MNTNKYSLVFLLGLLFIKMTLSATIIITPTQTNKSSATNPTETRTDSKNLVEIIRDYFGCAQFVNGTCVRCQESYFLNLDSKCSRVSDTCRNFNIDKGLCTLCAKGSYTIDGICYSDSKPNPLKDHCTIWNDKQCLQCEKGYYLSKVTGSCKPVSENFQCRNWNDDGNCSVCNREFLLKQNQCIKVENLASCAQNQILNQNNECELIPQNCQTWDSFNGKCVQCFEGFDWQNWKCICSPKGYCQNSGCLRYNLNNRKQCEICKSGYIFENGQCNQKPLPKQCLKWNDEKTACAKCSDKWIINLYTGMCMENVEKCQKYSISGQCQSCFEGFQLFNNKCQKIIVIPNCQKQNLLNRQKCDQCKQGYILSNDTCSEKPLPKNCLKWNSDKSGCGQCVDKWILTQKNQCIELVENCVKYSLLGQCTQCSVNYDLVNKKCQLFTIENCQSYSNQTRRICIQCSDGYALEQNRCKERPLPKDCVQWNQDKTACGKCKQGLIVSNGKCFAIVQNCQTYNSAGICNLCTSDYDLVDGKCQIHTIANCLSYNSKSKRQCIQCAVGFIVSDKVCIDKPLPKDCLKWNQNFTSCAQCRENLILNQNVCITPIKNCLKYTSSGDCASCIDNYEIINKNCQIIITIANCDKYLIKDDKKLCQTCVPGYSLDLNGACAQKQLQASCLKWNSNKTGCGQCKKDYILNITSGDCVSQIHNCKAYNPSGYCLECLQNYELAENSCFIKAANMNSSQIYGCDTWNFTVNKCSDCYNDFLLNKQGFCFYNEDHCLQRNNRSYCLKCQEGYRVNSGNCQLINNLVIENKTGCKLFDWVNNQCLVCEDQFVRSEKGTCQKPIDNCIQQDGSKCIKCLANHDLKDGKCITFATSRCIEKNDKGLCKRCENSFALINGDCKTFKQLGTILLDYTQFSPDKLKDKIVIFTDEQKV